MRAAVSAHRLTTRARARRSACAISSSALSPSASAQQLLGLARRVAELEQPVARERPRLLRRRRAGATIGARAGARRVAVDAHLLAQLDDDPLGGALADPRHRLEARRVARRERRRSARAAAPPRAPRARPSGRPPGRTAASGTGRAPARSESRTATSASSRTIRCVCSVTCSPTGGHVAQRLRGDRRAVADAPAQDHDVIGAAHRDLAAQQRDHRARPRERASHSGAQLAWQIATASASAA